MRPEQPKFTFVRAGAVVVMLAVLVVLLGSLAGCGAAGPTRDDERYEKCLDAGGSFEAGDDVDEFTCTLPRDGVTP